MSIVLMIKIFLELSECVFSSNALNVHSVWSEHNGDHYDHYTFFSFLLAFLALELIV